MKKLVFFIPVMFFVLFYGFIAICAIGAISPVIVVWITLLLAAGVLLSKTIFWGALLGILPAIHLIYMSTQDTGQVMNIEFPSGIILLIFYLVCGYLTYRHRVPNQKK